MEQDEIEAASKSGTNIRNDKTTVIDYDEDRVRLEFLNCVQYWIFMNLCVDLYIYLYYLYYIYIYIYIFIYIYIYIYINDNYS